MRILHTSDWHIGRTFHKFSTLEALESVFVALVNFVAEKKVDVVLASGDIFDSSTPSAHAVRLLDTFLLAISGAGARVVLTSGNHDSPARLGARSAFAHQAGVHVLTETSAIATPITIADEFGDVHFYGVPYVEPAHQRHVWTEAESMRSQKDALAYALALARTDWNARGGRAVLLAHTFVQGSESESTDSERDIVGGVDKVPVAYFADFTYAALGHIHGRATLAENVRYSGAPLHYSFSEAGKARGGWLLDLDLDGLTSVEWVELPVPRPLTVITGTLQELLTEQAHAAAETHWIKAVVTDVARPMSTQKRLQSRFPHLAEITFAPTETLDASGETYAHKIAGKTDLEIVDTFLVDVRNGEGTTSDESELLRAVISGGAER